MADFIAEFTSLEGPEGEPKASVNEPTLDPPPLWFLYVDGSSNKHLCGADLVLTSPLPTCVNVEYAVRLGFKVSNNEFEYEALLADLKLATSMGAKRLHIVTRYWLRSKLRRSTR